MTGSLTRREPSSRDPPAFVRYAGIGGPSPPFHVRRLTRDAQTAADWGLVNRVVPRERLAQETLELAARITSSHTLAIGKIAFYQQLDRALPEVYKQAGAVMAANAVTPDFREGIDAFLSKREPHWRGRA